MHEAQLDGAWGEFVGQYQRLMDEVMPYLPVAEQVVYHRLFRLSHGRRSAYVQCRYEELALALWAVAAHHATGPQRPQAEAGRQDGVAESWGHDVHRAAAVGVGPQTCLLTPPLHG